MAICVATLRVHNCCWGLGHRCAVRVCAILALRWTHLSIYGCSISRLAMVLSHTASLVRLRACRCADSRLLFGHSTVRYIHTKRTRYDICATSNQRNQAAVFYLGGGRAR